MEADEIHTLIESLLSFLETRDSLSGSVPEVSLPTALFSLSLREEKQYIAGELSELGQVLHFTEGKLVVRSTPGAPVLNLESTVCDRQGLVIGVVDDVLGSVEHPHYSIDAYHRLQDGDTVFFPVETAKYLHNISRRPGTDKSGIHDEEIDDSEDSEEEKTVPSAPPRSFQILKRPPASLD